MNRKFVGYGLASLILAVSVSLLVSASGSAKTNWSALLYRDTCREITHGKYNADIYRTCAPGIFRQGMYCFTVDNGRDICVSVDQLTIEEVAP